MKLLIISDQYLPIIRSGSLLIHDLIREFLLRGHEITLITSAKNSNKETKIKNLKIIRLFSFSHKRNNYIIKGVNQILLTISLIIEILFFRSKFDKIFIYSPPLLFGLVGIFFPKQKKIVSVQDFFPENAINLGILKNILLINIYKFIEKNVYKINDNILVNSINGKKYLKKSFPDIKNKVIFNYNWTSQLKKKVSRQKRGGKFKFIFGGSIGPSQEIQRIYKIFKKLENICSIDIFTDQSSIIKLKKEINFLKIKNIKVKKTITNLKFAERIKYYNSALITLSNNNKTPFIPGKFNFYCANGINVTAIVHRECDLNDIIKKNNLGFVTHSSKEEELLKFLENVIKSKKHQKLNINSLKFAKKNFNIQKICSKIERI